ncbi:TPA: Atxe2 family lasso peptide isopeptidase [Stenotrophomonas maltophilia]|nr:Atxe2 family lasso peptide isopeptidase [Stenotrophomonas maltophilia]
MREPGPSRAPHIVGLLPSPRDRRRANITRATILFAIVLLLLPGISLAQVISPRRLLEVVDLGNPVISPDGRSVAFRTEQASVEHNRYDTAWYVQPVDGTHAPLRVADGGTPLREYVSGVVKPSPAVWSPDGRWIYYRALIGGEISIWRAAANGSGAHAVTRDAADVRSFVLSPDGRTVTYSVGATRAEVIDAEQSEYDRGIRIDETTFVGAGLFRSSQLEGRLATQRFIGDWFSSGPLLALEPDRWKAVDVATSATRDLQASEHPPTAPTAADLTGVQPAPWRMATHPSDGRIAILTRIGDDTGLTAKPDVELAVLRAHGAGVLATCSAALCRGKAISDIQWRPNSDEVLFTVADRHEGRAQALYSWNVSTDVVHPITRARGLLRGSSLRPWDIPCGLSFEALVCVASEADGPPRLERVDLVTGERRVLFEPNATLAADMAAATPARLIQWSDSRGREFTGQLFEARPKDPAGRTPLFVTLYTCDGLLRGGVGDEWPLATLAESGISALCINGLPGQRVDPEEQNGQGLFALESVVQLLSAQGKIDASKIGMGGLSAGSEVMMWTAMRSNILTAASSASPSITPTWYLFNSLRESFRESAERLWQLGTPADTPEQWRAISPAFNVERLQTPILFQMPEQEYLMALDYAVPLMRARRADLYVFPNEPHIKIQPRHKLAVYMRNLDWFRFWLQGYEDPDPAKAEQYGYWRAMRDAAPRQHAGSGR